MKNRSVGKLPSILLGVAFVTAACSDEAAPPPPTPEEQVESRDVGDDAQVEQLPSPLYLTYMADTGEFDSPRLDSCWLTGPQETLVLAEISEPPNYVGWDADCTVEEEYIGAYAELTLKPLKVAGDHDFDGDIEVVAVAPVNPIAWNLNEGDTVLVSIRNSLDVAFSMSILPVQMSARPASGRNPPDLPSTWEALAAEALDTQENHETVCTEPYAWGYADSRRMTSDEFAVWIRSPEPKRCAGDAGVDSEELQPGDVVEDDAG